MESPSGAEELQTIGAKLRQKRTEMGVTLRQVNVATLIPEHNLRAIEAGNWESLPEPIYVQGFIRKYAQFLGLEVCNPHLPEASVAKRQGWSASSMGRLGTVHFYLLYILFVVGVVTGTSISLSQPSDPVDWDNQPVGITPPVAIAPPPSPPVPIAPALPVNLSMVTVGEAWVRVTVDGAVEFEGILAEGKTLAWSAKQEIVVRSGNGAAVSVSFNGGAMQPMGGAGAVVEQTYRPAANSGIR